MLAAYPQARWHQAARVIALGEAAPPSAANAPFVAVVTAGTSDIPVAEEAALTLEFLGHNVRRVNDVGVAGIHRLMNRLDVLRQAQIVIAVAGMEGALASVLGGLVACPVVAVPTSVGYGASFGGLAALLAMLNSCAPGVAVVNIDNGFGAAVHAHQIMRITHLPPNPLPPRGRGDLFSPSPARRGGRGVRSVRIIHNENRLL